MTHQPDDKPAEASRPDFLPVTIDRDAEVPIGVQLAWALRSRIGDGQLEPGQRLPGLRELAEASGVNVNTVRAVYQRLEHEGLIDSQQGSGTFVTALPRRPGSVSAIAATAAREACEAGVDPREVAAALYVSPEASGEDEGAERRRLLRAQIGALERALGEMETTHPGLAPAPHASQARIGPTLLSTDELELVRGLLVRRLATVQQAIDAHLLSQTEQADAKTAGRTRTAQPRAGAATAAKPVKAEPKRPARPRPSTRPAPAGT